MVSQDFYETLGVGRQASAADIKKAYRRLAKEFHPDRNPDGAAEDKFRQISEAYQVLSDDQKRAAYDQFGTAAFEGIGQGGAGFDAGGFQGFGASFADVFDDLFGEFRGRRTGTQTRGGDVRYNLEITLEDAFKGRSTKIRVPSTVNCGDCEGSGAAGDSRPTACSTCNGVGRVRERQSFGFAMVIERSCPACHGAGQVISNPCTNCSGAGRVRKEKAISINIPAGVEEGTRVRLAGEGEVGVRDGPPGDLYIFISLKDHQLFQREGHNLYCRVPIPMTAAALGGSIDVPSLDGIRTAVTVPAGTQAGHQFRLKGKGMPAMRGAGPSGDLYVQALVETPVNLSKKQQELLRNFESVGKGKKTNPETEGFLQKLKEFWEGLKD